MFIWCGVVSSGLRARSIDTGLCLMCMFKKYLAGGHLENNNS